MDEAKIEGVPEGWRLVRIGKPKAGEYYIAINGEACEAKLLTRTVLQWGFPVIEKIEQPKQYRPFANAKEFEPHRDRWLIHPEGEANGAFQVLEYDDTGIWANGMTEKMSYAIVKKNGLRFDDGSPFGVEVTE